MRSIAARRGARLQPSRPSAWDSMRRVGDHDVPHGWLHGRARGGGHGENHLGAMDAGDVRRWFHRLRSGPPGSAPSAPPDPSESARRHRCARRLDGRVEPDRHGPAVLPLADGVRRVLLLASTDSSLHGVDRSNPGPRSRAERPSRPQDGHLHRDGVERGPDDGLGVDHDPTRGTPPTRSGIDRPDRFADRSAEPPRLRSRAGHDDRRCRSARSAAHLGDVRPRPLQGIQRPSRPPRR